MASRSLFFFFFLVRCEQKTVVPKIKETVRATWENKSTCHCCVNTASATQANMGTCWVTVASATQANKGTCCVTATSATRENKGTCCVTAASATWENKDTCCVTAASAIRGNKGICVTAASATRANKPGHLSLLCDCSQCNTCEQVIVVWLQPMQHGRTRARVVVAWMQPVQHGRTSARVVVAWMQLMQHVRTRARVVVFMNATSATWENKDTCSWWVYRQSCCPRNLELVVQYKNQGSIFKRSPWFFLLIFFVCFVFMFELFYRLGGTWNEKASSFNAFSTQ